MSIAVAWEAPPPKPEVRGNSRTSAVADALDIVSERPGEWAAIKVYTEPDKLGTARSWASSIRKRFIGFDTLAAVAVDGKVKVYAKYVGMNGDEGDNGGDEAPEDVPAETEPVETPETPEPVEPQTTDPAPEPVRTFG